MGRIDPELATSTDVSGGGSSTVWVKFTGLTSPYQQLNVTYLGDTDALGPNPPSGCPWPATPNCLGQTSFAVPTVMVTSTKTVTVRIHGDTKFKDTTFTVSPV